jgi:hypothetical protein
VPTGDYEGSDIYIKACYERASHSEERAFLLRLRSQNNWMRNDFNAALKDTLLALHILGIDLDPNPTLEMADAMFEQVKSEILAVGFDAILAIPRSSESRTDLGVALLGDAGTHVYWSTGEGFTDVIGLTVRFTCPCHHVLISRVTTRRFNWLCGTSNFIHSCLFVYFLWLSSGMSPGSALGFFWALGGVYRNFCCTSTSHDFCSRCGTKGTVSILCGPRKVGVAYCRASRNECRQMVCPIDMVIIHTQRILQSLVGHVLFHGLRL